MSRQSIPRKWIAILMVLVLALGSISLPTQASSTTTVMDAELPTARDGTAAVKVGNEIYVFGGHTASGSRTDEILRYDPGTDTLTVLTATLPVAKSGQSAIYDGQHVYLFGGWNSGYSNKVIRFDPATESVATMAATLPSGRTYTSAVWTGDAALIFGGATNCSPCTTDQILSYDPATDSLTTKSASLPSGRAGTSAVWSGDAAYVFGGHTVASATEFDQIIRYDPVADSVMVLPQKLPSARTHTSAVWVGDTAYVIGGKSCGGSACDTIVEFDPLAGSVITNTTALTTARFLTSAAEAGRSIYIFGGFDSTRTDQILGHGPVIPNSPPIIDTLVDQTLTVGDPFTLTVTATDADDEPITLGLGPLPSGATFTDNGDGTGDLAWTPALSQLGDHALEASAGDGTDSTTQGFTLTVVRGPDNHPVLDAIGNQTVTAEDLLTMNVSASDADGDPITLTATPLPPGASFTDNGDGTGSLEWTPERADVGQYTVTLSASSFGNSTEETFGIEVLAPPNSPPVLSSVADLTVNVGTLVNLTFSATDVDGDNITFGLTPMPTQLTFTDHGDGTANLLWNTTLDHLGTTTFSLEASDGDLSDIETFGITIVKGPPPSIDPIADQSALEGTDFTMNVTAIDPQGEPVNLTLAPLPSGATFEADPVNGTATFTWNGIPFTAAGSYPLTLTASNDNASATETFTLTIIDVDRPPVFTTFDSPARLGLGDGLTTPIGAADPDGTPVSLSATGLPSGATFTDNGGGTATLAWTNAGPLGTYNVAVTASSGGAETLQVFTIEVVAQYGFTLLNASPSILTASPGETVTLTTNVRNTGLQDDTYAFSLQDLSSGRNGFILTGPTSVAVAAGETEQVNVTIQVLADGSQSRPRLTAVAQEDPNGASRFLNWRVDVPIVIDIILAEADPTVTGGSALLDFGGTVRLTWADGSPVAGQSFDVAHEYLGQTVPVLGLFEGVTDSDGNWTFGGTDQPLLGLVGDHTIELTVERGLLTHRTTTSWSVEVVGEVGVPDLPFP